jgi:hypothetical protein
VLPDGGAPPVSGPTPGQRLGDCTRVPSGAKVDYQCGEARGVIAILEVKPGSRPIEAAEGQREAFWPLRAPQVVTVDGRSLEVARVELEEGARPLWVAYAVDGSTVRQVVCTAETEEAEATCMRIVPLLAVYGAVEPEPPGPPLADKP